MTFFLCGFKYFHGSLPDSPKQRLPQARTGKVRCNFAAYHVIIWIHNLSISDNSYIIGKTEGIKSMDLTT